MYEAKNIAQKTYLSFFILKLKDWYFQSFR